MVVRRALGMSSLTEAEDRSLLRDSKAAAGCSWSARYGICVHLTIRLECHTKSSIINFKKLSGQARKYLLLFWQLFIHTPVISKELQYTGWHTKKWTISFCCLQSVWHTHTENFYNTSTVPRTLTKMLFSMSTLHCNNPRQSFPKLRLPAQSNPLDINMFTYDIMNDVDVTKNI